MWTHASGEHLAGYEQQDAHEFLIALLDALHMDLLPPPPSASKGALLSDQHPIDHVFLPACDP